MKFRGEVGYGESVETAPGVWVDTIVERTYYGDVERLSNRLRESTDSVNDEMVIGNAISIVADPYAFENFQAIRYIRWQGGLRKVAEVDVRRPRLWLRLGGKYHGPVPTP